MPVSFSNFAASVETETAFDVLAIAKRLMSEGKDVIELEIGDSPFPTSPSATEAGIQAIRDDRCHYGPSAGIPEFRAASAEYVNKEYSLDVKAENVVAGPGAKNFEQLFCEAFVNPGDGVLVFSPHFPTYQPNIARRGARMVISTLEQSNEFRPNLNDVEKFLQEDVQPKAIFLNSPHNPTGGIATKEDVRGLADLVRGKDIAVLSDEPYDRMAWQGSHYSLLAEEGMLDQCVGAYTCSKSFSMSGWRIGFAVSSAANTQMLVKLTNSTLSCVPPFTQLAAAAAMQNDLAERDRRMKEFERKVNLLVDELNKIDGVNCLLPGGSFYVFPNVKPICNRLGITSHGLAMFLLEAADESKGVACLGGECFGAAGYGFLRLSTAVPDERLVEGAKFIESAINQTDKINSFLESNQKFRLGEPYTV